jgi:hypothetical protein
VRVSDNGCETAISETTTHDPVASRKSRGSAPIQSDTMVKVRYLYAQSGSVIGYMDQQDKRLYGQGGSIIANFNPSRTCMYRPDGSVYGYISGIRKKYLYGPSGDVIGYFTPGFLELV